MKYFTLSIASALALGSGVALAADLPSRTQVPVFAAAPFTWTGFHVGASAGFLSLENSNWYDPNNHYTSGPGGIVDSDPSHPTRKGRGNSAVGGLQAGFDLQSGSTVFGLETDVSFGHAKNSAGKLYCDNCDDPVWYYKLDQKTNSTLGTFGTLRGRVGVALDRTLVYGTAGLAVGKISTRYNIVGNDDSGEPDELFSLSKSQWKLGWTAGGGIEHAYGNALSVKAEALYYDLGETHIAALYNPVSPFYAHAFSQNSKHNGFLARVGLNYRFGGK